MIKSILHTGPSLQVKVFYPADGTEKTIGFATGLTFTVTQGQKAIYVVDSPFPAETSQAAGPSAVRGSMTMFLPKGSTPESAGLVPYRTDATGQINMAATKYLCFRIYDRVTSSLVLSLDYVKVSQYSMGIRAKTHVTCQIEFEGSYATPGNAGS